MTESNPSSNTLEEFLKLGMADYESDTAASIIYDHPPATPPVCGTARIAPKLFVVRKEVSSPLAQRAAVDPALGALHNTLGEDQAQYPSRSMPIGVKHNVYPQRVLTVVPASYNRLWMNAFAILPGSQSQHGTRDPRLS
uniref:Uncharacterized protein n=1 Tax=Peronospora matthiolae TaxID=2874970 RepID=A0AAV1U891_9STRA